jgi:hypothetical protein
MDAIAGNSSEAMVPHCDKKSSSKCKLLQVLALEEILFQRPLVERLRDAVLHGGKTNLSEWANFHVLHNPVGMEQ